MAPGSLDCAVMNSVLGSDFQRGGQDVREIALLRHPIPDPAGSCQNLLGLCLPEDASPTPDAIADDPA
jgi:hypothetical protein